MLKKLLDNMIGLKLFKWILLIFAGFFAISTTFANYESFLNNLRQTGIEVDKIIDNNQVSRYELTRLLNAVNCEDCINTPSWMIDDYNNNWRNDFVSMPGKDFRDISYRWWIYNWETYYYCVSYVWDNVRMRWYPEWLSPVCNWKFCGTRNTTLWEFLQVVLNIADQYVYQKYLMDWSKIKSWMDSLKTWSYPDEYLNQEDKKQINEHANSWLSGSLPNEESMQAYIKYCMFNLESCGMQSFGEIKKWYRPVAELNILYDNNIVEHEKFKDWDIHELVEWEYVLKTLYNLFKLVDCDFDYDYDCDDNENIKDNCPNHYNPNQKDTDGDWVWDVCDDDIDGDGIKNPIWIVDDLWRIVLSKRQDGMDNCIFVVNTNQLDSNWNWVWDACENSKNNLWMYIKTYNLNNPAPVTVEFEAITEWTIKWEISWDFGDWEYMVGKKVSHTFLKDWFYRVQANALWINNDANASTSLIIGKNILENHSMQIIVDKVSSWLPGEIKFKMENKWDFDKFERNFGDGNIIEKNTNEDITKIFREENSYMITLKWFKNNEVVAVANTIIWAGNNRIWSSLSANNLMPKKWQTISLKTKISWFNEKDIDWIEWNIWNEKIINNKLLNIEHIYKSAWTVVIVQKIKLNDWSELQNFLTITIRDESLETSYTVETSINKLISSVFSYINFKLKNIGILPEILMVLNRYDNWITDKTYENLPSWPKHFEYKYNKEWIFFPKTSVFVNECISLDNVATIAIANKDICLEAKLNWTLNQFKCDMDGDWIPDICDDDIDGDGIKNLIWLIDFELPDCKINWDNINKDIWDLHNNVCSLDNCPIYVNKDQMDLNNNWWWDQCDNLLNFNNKNSDYWDNSWIKDSDWDWIPDHLDACPEIPENYNGIEDSDGCPEIWASENCSIWNMKYNIWWINDNWINDNTIIVSECFSCPCVFSDFANDLNIDDKVKAILRDINMETLYSESIPESIKQFLK